MLIGVTYSSCHHAGVVGRWFSNNHDTLRVFNIFFFYRWQWWVVVASLAPAVALAIATACPTTCTSTCCGGCCCRHDPDAIKEPAARVACFCQTTSFERIVVVGCVFRLVVLLSRLFVGSLWQFHDNVRSIILTIILILVSNAFVLPVVVVVAVAVCSNNAKSTTPLMAIPKASHCKSSHTDEGHGHPHAVVVVFVVLVAFTLVVPVVVILVAARIVVVSVG